MGPSLPMGVLQTQLPVLEKKRSHAQDPTRETALRDFQTVQNFEQTSQRNFIPPLLPWPFCLYVCVIHSSLDLPFQPLLPCLLLSLNSLGLGPHMRCHYCTSSLPMSLVGLVQNRTSLYLFGTQHYRVIFLVILQGTRNNINMK